MASGDVTEEYDNRERYTPICGLTLEIVVADGTSEKEEELDALDHTCMNCMLMDIYFKLPVLVTPHKKARLELLTEQGDEIFSTSDLDAQSVGSYPIHRIERCLRGKSMVKIVCDANVSGAKTFKIEIRGI